MSWHPKNEVQHIAQRQPIVLSLLDTLCIQDLSYCNAFKRNRNLKRERKEFLKRNKRNNQRHQSWTCMTSKGEIGQWVGHDVLRLRQRGLGVAQGTSIRDVQRHRDLGTGILGVRMTLVPGNVVGSSARKWEENGT